MRKILTIDGPGGVGKGTVAKAIAKELGFAYLDSGAVYRVAAIYLAEHNLVDAVPEVQAKRLSEMDFCIKENAIVLNGQVVKDEYLHSEQVAKAASKIAEHKLVRSVLLQCQRDYEKEKNLVADGRDMGTVVFPEAQVKVFLDAIAQIRAARRYKQLMKRGEYVNLENLEAEIAERDKRDRSRENSPLKAADDAVVIDTTELSVEEVLDRVRKLCQVFN